jgi:hypothetical protein
MEVDLKLKVEGGLSGTLGAVIGSPIAGKKGRSAGTAGKEVESTRRIKGRLSARMSAHG